MASTRSSLAFRFRDDFDCEIKQNVYVSNVGVTLLVERRTRETVYACDKLTVMRREHNYQQKVLAQQ